MIQFEYEVRYTQRRKSIALRVDGEKVIVLAPKRCSRKHIQHLIIEKSAWIQKQFNKIQQARNDIKNKIFAQGGEFYYLGNLYYLNIVESNQKCVLLSDNLIHIHLPDITSLHIQKQLSQWYLQQAKNTLPQKTVEVVALTNRPLRAVKFGHFKGQWGSCNRAGDIRYNWLLMQAPEPVIDYIIAHEASHLSHMNHSKNFWAVVKSICPDYKVHRKWLRQNGHLLKFDTIGSDVTQ